jgi:hypothetical protein
MRRRFGMQGDGLTLDTGGVGVLDVGVLADMITGELMANKW